MTLFPTFFAADLGEGRVNVAAFDEGGRTWLESQLRDGKTSLIARIVGPGGGESLFAWDSGAGPATGGQGPALVLALGPAPATAPPLPTEAVIVATDTPTPVNVLTAVVHALTATAAAEQGTPAYRFVSPTPSPANIATMQARALLANLPAIVPDTPTPANAATAEIVSLLATADAFLTGTPTPPPSGFVTPIVITPTPMPMNVMTAAAQALTRSAEPLSGTPTPPPYNLIVATITPPIFVIVDTATPANEATATIQAAYATAVTILTGTFTPFPYNAVTATLTPTPTETGIPPTPTIAPTATKAPTQTRTPRPGRAQPRPTATRRGAAPAATPTIPTSVCTDPRVQIGAPKSGATISDQLSCAVGRCTKPSPPMSWSLPGVPFLPAATKRPSGAPARSKTASWARFVLTALPDGTYTLSLRVLTSAGDPPPPCRVVIQVRNR